MAGYGDVTYVDSDQGNGAFSSRFVPIFLFQLNDKLHVEAELEFSVDEFGAVETELEYADMVVLAETFVGWAIEEPV